MRTDSQSPAVDGEQIDVLVIGGGPAGTTAATLLKRRGWSVVLLEKDRHPRFHIGESLLPMNLPILERLGVLDQIEAIGVKKMGADFTYGIEDEEYRTYHFSRALGESGAHAYEVRRQDFDELLFRNCVASGVTALENHTVTAVQIGKQDQRHRVECRDASGLMKQWRPRYVLDASGRETFLSSSERWKEKNPRHASAAIFGHFKGVPRRPSTDAGNISVYWMPHGWIWMIPLRDDVMSIGAVCWPEYLKSRKGDPAQFLRDTLNLNNAVRRRTSSAESINEVQVTGNYSYRSRRVAGNGYMLLGDAFAFVDPVFSSGVFLAMNSAECAVPVVEDWLKEDKVKHFISRRRYERMVRKGVRNFSWFIYRFTSPAMRNLFRNPRNICKVEQAVVSMLAGDVFSNPTVQMRLRLFRIIYRISWLLTLRQSMDARRNRLKNPHQEFA